MSTTTQATTTQATTSKTRAEWRVPAMAAGTTRHRAVYGLPEKTVSANWPIIGQSLKASLWDAYLYSGTHNSALRNADKAGTDEFFQALHGNKSKTAQSRAIRAVLEALDNAGVKAGSCNSQSAYAAAMQIVNEAWLSATPKKTEAKKETKNTNKLYDAISLILAELAAGKLSVSQIEAIRAALPE